MGPYITGKQFVCQKNDDVSSLRRGGRDGPLARKTIIGRLLKTFSQHGHWIDYRTGRLMDNRVFRGREYRRVVSPQEIQSFCTAMGKVLPKGGELFTDKVSVCQVIDSMVHDATTFDANDSIVPFGYLRLVYLLFGLIERWGLFRVGHPSKQYQLQNVISIPSLDRLITKHIFFWTSCIHSCGNGNCNLEHVNPMHLSFLQEDLSFEWNERLKIKLQEEVSKTQARAKNFNTATTWGRGNASTTYRSGALLASAKQRMRANFAAKLSYTTPTRPIATAKRSIAGPSHHHRAKAVVTASATAPSIPTSKSVPGPSLSATTLSRPASQAPATGLSIQVSDPRLSSRSMQQPSRPFSPPPPPLVLPPFKDLLNIPPIIQERFIRILNNEYSSAAPVFNYDAWERNVSPENKLSPRKFLIACHYYKVAFGERIKLLDKMLDSLDSFEVIDIENEEKQTDYDMVQICKIYKLQFIVAVMNNWHILEVKNCNKGEAQWLADKFYHWFNLIKCAADDDKLALLRRVEEKWKSQKMTTELLAWTQVKFPTVVSYHPSHLYASPSPIPSTGQNPPLPLKSPLRSENVAGSFATPSAMKRRRIAFATVDDDKNKNKEVVVLSSGEDSDGSDTATVAITPTAAAKKIPALSTEAHRQTKKANAKGKAQNISNINCTIKEEEVQIVIVKPKTVVSTQVLSHPICATNQIQIDLPPLPPVTAATTEGGSSSTSSPRPITRRRNTSSKLDNFLDRIYKYARDKTVPPEIPSVMKDENLVLPGRLIVGTSTGVEPDRQVEVLNTLFDWLLKESVKEEAEVRLKVLFATTYLAIRWKILTNRRNKVDKATLMKQLYVYFTLTLQNLDTASAPNITFHSKLPRLLQKWTDSYLNSFRAVMKELQGACLTISSTQFPQLLEEQKAEKLKGIYDLIIDLGDVFMESAESNMSHCDIDFCRYLMEHSNEGGAEMKKACMWSFLGIIATLKDKRHSARVAEMLGAFLFSLLKISVVADSKHADKIALQLLYSWKSGLLKILSASEIEILFHNIEDEGLRNKFKALKLPFEKSFQDFYITKN